MLTGGAALAPVESATVLDSDKQQLQTAQHTETSRGECDDGRVVNCRTLPLFNYTDLTPPPVGADAAADILQDENCPSVIISPPSPLVSDNMSIDINNNIDYYDNDDNDDNNNYNDIVLVDEFMIEAVAEPEVVAVLDRGFYGYRHSIIFLLFLLILFKLTDSFYLYYLLLLTLLLSFIVVIIIIVILYYLLFLLLLSFIAVVVIVVIIVVYYQR